MFARMTPFAAPIAVLALLANPLSAQEDASVDVLFESLGLPDMLAIMREEGIVYGAQIGEDLFPERADAEWAAIVESIYDTDAMQAQVLASLSASLTGKDVAAMDAFFESDLGTTIVGLEISARRALLDDSVEEASKEVAALARADETPRYQMITEFVEANDLIETNVVGAMNSNYAFYTGLLDGGGFPQDLTESQILADVWSQEPEIRVNTTEWVYTFLLLAYQPLGDEELQAYVDFSTSDAGQDLNAALFVAFDGMFEQISRNLGLAATRFMTGQEL